MSTTKNLLAGLGGAIVLNLIHESLKHKANTPRVDLLGEEALQKALGAVGAHISNPDTLYKTTLGADLLSNTLYYGAIGAGDPRTLWTRAIAMGLVAGIGAVKLPEPMGLDDAPVAASSQKQALTVGYYLAGSLVTASILTLMRK